MNYNPTIDLGDIVSVVVLLVGFIGVIKRIAVMEFKVNELWQLKDRMFNNDH